VVGWEEKEKIELRYDIGRRRENLKKKKDIE